MNRARFLPLAFVIVITSQAQPQKSPAAPELFGPLPMNGEVVLRWSHVADAEMYDVDVSEKPNFNPTVYTASVPDTTVNVSGLQDGTTYYWRVRTLADKKKSSWVEDSFPVGAVPPEKPILYYPSDGAERIPLVPILAWSSVNGANEYILQVSSKKNFKDLITEITIPDTTATIDGLESDALYYWRVRASGDAGVSEWREASFTTAGALPPPPVILSPAPGAVDVAYDVQLVWTSDAMSDSFRVEVSLKKNFSGTPLVFETVPDTMFDLESLLPAYTYYWRVRGLNTDGEGEWSEAGFTTRSPVPTAPVLHSPPDNAVDITINPTLVWRSSVNALQYVVEVSRSKNFNTTPVSLRIGTDTTHTFSGLSYNTTYYWRVFGTNDVGPGPAASGSFTTETGLPDLPQLAWPDDSSTGISTTPLLQWFAVSGAENYTLEVSTKKNFGGTPVVGLTTDDTASTVPELESITLYYWRVRSNNAQGSSEWSERSFTTAASEVVAVPELDSPADKATDVSVNPILTWRATTGATQYTVQASTKPNFSDFVIDSTGVADTMLAVTGLEGNQKYYWRVQATDGINTSEWSSVWDFRTTKAGSDIAQPLLVYPEDKSNTVEPNPQLVWNAVPMATSYGVEISTDANFKTVGFSLDGVTDTVASVSGLLYGEKYYWHVRASDGTTVGDWSNRWSFTVMDQPLDAPVLSSPEDKSKGSPTNPAFIWFSVESAVSYTFQLSETKQFNSPLVDSSGITDTAFAATGLTYGTTYYWRVAASDGEGTGPFSNDWRFETAAESFSGPALLDPPDNSAGISTMPTLTWGSVEGAAHYHLQVSDKTNFKSLVLDETGITDTLFAVGLLEVDTKYFWRVSVTTTVATSEWSEEWEFTTGTSQVGAPLLKLPQDEAIGVSIEPVLSWGSVEGAVSYSVQLSSHKNFNKILFDSSGIPDHSFQLNGLEPNTQYFWRAGTQDGGGALSWAEPWSFTTGTGTLSAPVLAAPADRERGVAIDVALLWHPVIGADSYAVEVSSKSNFKETLFDTSGVTDTLLSVPIFDGKSRYYWRVRAKKDTTLGDWSVEWTFSTGKSLLTVPTLLFPPDGANEISTSPELEWNITEGASFYEIQVSEHPKFKTLNDSHPQVGKQSYTVSQLKGKKKYYWRVRSKTDVDTSDWSETWNFMTTTVTSAERTAEVIPSEYRLDQNFPNPFNPTTTIRFAIPMRSAVQIQVFNIAGEVVGTLADQAYGPGIHQIQWDAGGLSSGVYFYHILAKSSNSPGAEPFMETRKLLLVK